jgi:desulfoferrodoxin (superoxide reductase-like protein)
MATDKNKTTIETNGKPTMTAAEDYKQQRHVPVTIEYGKDTLKFLNDDLVRLHETVRANPDAQWAVDQIRVIHTAVLSGTPIHTLPSKQTK